MIGPMTNSVCIIMGALLGNIFGGRISPQVRNSLNLMFGSIALGIGVSMTAKGIDLPPIIISILFGTIFGIMIKLEDRLLHLSFWTVDKFSRKPKQVNKHQKESLSRDVRAINDEKNICQTNCENNCETKYEGDKEALYECLEECPPQNMEHISFRDQFAVATLIFCVSGLGLIGPMEEGLTNAPSLLMIKGVLDCITAMLIAANIGACIAILSIPQFCIQMSILLAATTLYPLTTPEMLANFSACGGFIMMGGALRQFGLVQVPVLCMLPSLLIIMPLTALWAFLL